MIIGSPGQSKTARCDAGIVADRYRFVSADDGSTVVAGPVTTGITRTGPLRYKATVTLPSSDAEIQWDDGSGAWVGKEDVVVEGSGSAGSGNPTLSGGPWPVGTSVGAYTTRGNQVDGPPAGSVLATATVASDGTLTFPTLAAGVYIAAAQVSGKWLKVRFTV